MKRNLLVYTDFHEWMGGLYYVHNMVYALEQCEEALRSVNVYILVFPYNHAIFRDLETRYENVSLIMYDNGLYANIKRKIRKIIRAQIRHQKIEWCLLDGIVERYCIDLIFPFVFFDEKYISKGIVWIPDFQHFHLPDFFKQAHLDERKEQFLLYAKRHYKMVLSSQSALKDYIQHYGHYAENVYVIPFVSEISEELKCSDYYKIKEEYRLPDQYFLVSNQFWQHKNHILVFKAILKVRQKYGIEIKVVFTGLMEDDRNPKYIQRIKKYIYENQISSNIELLGLIARKAQLQIMQHALAVVQPSLFEGWGTVVEDAKTLGVPIIMSDLDVHYEQQVNNCIIFNRYDADELADILYRVWSGQTVFEKSEYDMRYYAQQYGNIFLKVICE